MSQKLPSDGAQKGFAVGRGLLAAAETLNFSMGESHSDSYGSSSQQHNRMMGYGDRDAQNRTTQLSLHMGNPLSSTMKLFTSLGLSPSDLDTLAQIPEEKITMETLPSLIKQLKSRKTEASRHLADDQLSQSFTPESLFRVGRNEWGDLQGGRMDRSVSSTSQSRNSQGDYGYRSSQDLSTHDYDMPDFGSSRDHQFSELSSDNYHGMGMSSSASDDLFSQRRVGAPSQSKMEDFMGIMPCMFPHVCTLCDFDVHSMMEWTQHTTGMRHAENRRVLLQLYPDWDPQMPTGRMSDSLSLNSRNPSDGLLGAAPSGVSRPRMGSNSNWGSDSGMDIKSSSYAPKVKSQVVVLKYGEKPKWSDIFNLADRFGTVQHNIILKNKAFLEFQSHQQALAMVNHFKKKPPMLNGKHISIYLSQDLLIIDKSKRFDADRTFPRDCGPVVFFSNLPRENEQKMELLTIAGRFGNVVKHLFLTDKAFVQMSNSKDAKMMVKYYSVHPLSISHRSIYVNICYKYKTLNIDSDKDRHGKEDRDESSQRSSRTSSKPSSKNETRTRSKSRDGPGEKTEKPKPKTQVVAKAESSDKDDQPEEAIGQKEKAAEESLTGTEQPEEQGSEEFVDTRTEQTEHGTTGEDAEMQHEEDPEQQPQSEEPTEQVLGDEEDENKKLKKTDEQEGMEQDEAALEESAEVEEFEEGDFPVNMDEFVTLDELAEEEEIEHHNPKSTKRSSSGSSRDTRGMRVINIIGFKRSYDYMEEILALAKPFGKVVRHLVLHSRPEAFLELESEEQAKAMVRFYSGNVIPSVCGKEVKVFHSITYATIQSGKVIYIGHIPPIKPGSEVSLLKIAEPYGKIKRYYINRAGSECFIEMVRGEDAEQLVKDAKLNPPRFEGKRLLVYISRKYKQLKHGIRPPTPEKRPTKRDHTDDEHENQASSQVKASKGTEEPPAKKVKEEKPDQEKSDQEKSSVPKEQQLEFEEPSTLNKSVSEENQESTEQPGEDSIESDSTVTKPKAVSDPEHASSEKNQELRESASVSTKIVKKPETLTTLGPYEPDVPVGVDYVKMGYYCRVCFLFYSNEDTAKRVHCSSQAHYDKLKKHLEKEKSKAQQSGEKK